MTRRVLQGEPPIEITLRRSVRARAYSLRVSRLDGRVTLSMPARAAEAAALDFARGKADWIRAAIAGAAPAMAVAAGTRLPVEGEVLELVPGPVRAVHREEGRLVLPDRAGAAGPRVAAYLKLLARQRLEASVTRHAAALGVTVGEIRLRDTRSRWGSCSSKGGLMFSWRLILAPPEVLDYVAAHEVAHLAVMDHSPKFWRVVAGLYPNWRFHRGWLRRHGAELHAYRFTA